MSLMFIFRKNFRINAWMKLKAVNIKTEFMKTLNSIWDDFKCCFNHCLPKVLHNEMVRWKSRMANKDNQIINLALNVIGNHVEIIVVLSSHHYLLQWVTIVLHFLLCSESFILNDGIIAVVLLDSWLFSNNLKN